MKDLKLIIPPPPRVTKDLHEKKPLSKGDHLPEKAVSKERHSSRAACFPGKEIASSSFPIRNKDSKLGSSRHYRLKNNKNREKSPVAKDSRGSKKKNSQVNLKLH